MAIIEGEARRVTVGSGDTMAMVRSSLKEMAIGGVLGAVVGGMVGMAIIAGGNPRALASLSRTQYACTWARNLSAMSAASFGIESIMRGIRGKDDLTSHMVSGSGGGLALSFVKHGLKDQPAQALSTAAVFAVLSGTIYKVEEIIRSRKASDTRSYQEVP